MEYAECHDIAFVFFEFITERQRYDAMIDMPILKFCTSKLSVELPS